jgi:class 3 adenylate cyclase
MSQSPRPQSATDLLERKELLALLEGADALNQTIGLPEVLQRILGLAQQLTGAVAGSVILHDPRRGDLYFAAATGPVETRLPTIRVAVGEGYAGKVFATGKPIREVNLTKDPMHSKRVDRETTFRTRSLLCVPLAHGQRRYGVMQLLNKRDGQEFTPRDEALLVRFGVQATIAIRNAALFERLLAASGLYAAPEVRGDIVERMAAGMPATREFLTVLFVDLRGSTQLAQQLGSPDRLQRMISELLSMLSTHVIGHRGIVNKFLGDGLMAIFRQQGAAEDALRASFAMLEGFEGLVATWRSRTSLHLKKFLGLGVGVVSEEVMLGAVGTEEAADFTVIGTPVNLASALQEAARGDRHVLCCSQTYERARQLVLDAEGPIVFELRKPTQEHGIEYEVFHVKTIRGGSLRPRVFVSFSHGDRELVERRILTPFEKRGLDVFSFAKGIPPATDWHKLIEEELERCDWFVAVVSERSIESEWVRGEVASALGRHRLDGRIVPLIVGGADLSKLDLRLALLQGLALDASDAAAKLDSLAVQMLGGSHVKGGSGDASLHEVEASAAAVDPPPRRGGARRRQEGSGSPTES